MKRRTAAWALLGGDPSPGASGAVLEHLWQRQIGGRHAELADTIRQLGEQRHHQRPPLHDHFASTLVTGAYTL